ncbi:MAG: hypothetical protein ACI9EQ_000949 [Bacteroidia bacterium]|jgi:hypothetical protein
MVLGLNGWYNVKNIGQSHVASLFFIKSVVNLLAAHTKKTNKRPKKTVRAGVVIQLLTTFYKYENSPPLADATFYPNRTWSVLSLSKSRKQAATTAAQPLTS